ncbi:MAG TPA: hypothetical protein VFR18_12490, partial [Terriglobia bacterium]|nr:hypothetical protein [Terriglobia bacterium]
MSTGISITRHRRGKQWLTVPVVFALGALCGCIDFDDQVLTYTHDVSTDRLLVYKDYHGIRGSDSDGLSEWEEEQLLSSWMEPRIFLFENWPSLSLDELREGLAKPLPSGESELDHVFETAYRKLVATVVASTHISNGPFYYDDAGRLSGVQRVTFHNLTELITLVNDSIRANYAKGAADATNDGETRSRLTRAAADPRPFVLLDGNRITARLSRSKDEYLRDLDEPVFQMLLESGMKMTFADGITTLTIGHVESGKTKLLFGQHREDRPMDGR